MPTLAEVWVIDTSSITEVRRKLSRSHQITVYASLTTFVNGGHLVFPTEVLKELERGSNPKSNPQDLPLGWCKKVQGTAVSNPPLATVKEVLGQVSEVLDPDKPHGTEEADPYILALAVELKRNGRDVAIITQETANRPGKLSLSSAAGLLKIPAVTMLPFLKSQGLLP